VSLSTSRKSVEKLQTSLQAKAKLEPGYRFYSLWDKICREDVLREAYRRSRANAGAPDVDGIDFEAIETQGSERWLGTLGEELRRKSYEPQPPPACVDPEAQWWPAAVEHPHGEGPRGPNRRGLCPRLLAGALKFGESGLLDGKFLMDGVFRAHHGHILSSDYVSSRSDERGDREPCIRI
jgi:hypothetical protein